MSCVVHPKGISLVMNMITIKMIFNVQESNDKWQPNKPNPNSNYTLKKSLNKDPKSIKEVSKQILPYFMGHFEIPLSIV